MFKQSDLPTLHRMQDAARRIQAMAHARACREYGLAFGSEGCATLDMCVINNSMIDYENGKPWREISYSHLRRARRIIDQSFRADSLVTAWYRRKCGIVVQS